MQLKYSILFFTFILLSCSFLQCNSSASKQQNGIAISDKEGFQQLMKEVTASYQLAEKWFSNSLRTKGIFRYNFLPDENKYSQKNNAIRQLMASRLMAELCQENPKKWLKKHRKNLEFLMKHWYKEDKDTIGYMLYNDKSKLGANAMMLRTLTISPLFDEYRTQARRLANSILALTDEQGAMTPFYIEPDYSYDKDYLLTFYSGEALVALVEYASKIGDMHLLGIAKRSQDYYINRYVTHLDKHYYPAYVPWHTISLNKLYHITKDKKYANAIFALNDKLLEIQDTTQYIGRFYNPQTPQYGKPHASSDGVYTEGLAYAYEIAVLLNDKKHQQKYLKALQHSMKNLATLQYDQLECEHAKFPHRCTGCFRTSATSKWCRIDTGQHIMDAFRKLLAIKKSV